MRLAQAQQAAPAVVQSTLTVLSKARLSMRAGYAEIFADGDTCEDCPEGTHLSACSLGQAIDLLPPSAELVRMYFDDDGADVLCWRW
jgi:hypothetical protein